MSKYGDKSLSVIAERFLAIGHLPYGDSSSRANPTRAQWAALRYFSLANRYSRTVSGFRAYYGVTPGTASETVRRLVRRDLLERHRSALDARSVRLDLTPKAWGMLRDDPARELTAAMSVLTVSEIAALASALEHVAAALATKQGKRVFGDCEDCKHFDAAWAEVRSRPRPGCRLMAVRLERDELRALCAKFEGR